MKTVVVEEYEALGEYFVDFRIRELTGMTFEQFCRRMERQPMLHETIKTYYEDMKQHSPHS